MSESGLAEMNEELDRAAWLEGRICDHRGQRPRLPADRACMRGTTTREIRIERLRKDILDHGLSEVIVGNRLGRPETYAQVFERLFGEPLRAREKSTPKGKSHAAA